MSIKQKTVPHLKSKIYFEFKWIGTVECLTDNNPVGRAALDTSFRTERSQIRSSPPYFVKVGVSFLSCLVVDIVEEGKLLLVGLLLRIAQVALALGVEHIPIAGTPTPGPPDGFNELHFRSEVQNFAPSRHLHIHFGTHVKCQMRNGLIIVPQNNI